LALKEAISLGLFGSVIAAAFQSAFHAKIHQKEVFLFLKNHFLDQLIKTIQNIKKKLIFLKTQVELFFLTSCLSG